jgi:hypothetical protein
MADGSLEDARANEMDGRPKSPTCLAPTLQDLKLTRPYLLSHERCGRRGRIFVSIPAQSRDEQPISIPGSRSRLPILRDVWEALSRRQIQTFATREVCTRECFRRAWKLFSEALADKRLGPILGGAPQKANCALAEPGGGRVANTTVSRREE